MLSYGALPLSFQEQSVTTVTAALGGEQLHAGLIAGAIGLALVVIYLVAYYRGLSLDRHRLACWSPAILTYTIMALLGPAIGFALNLPAVCGAIVAIGITADSFIVYFERIRDEIREGRTLRPAVERAWPRARRTILVSDFVSFLAAAVLFIVTVGKVQGFAFTLGLTTVLDVVVVFLFTKPLMTLLARRKFFASGHPWSGLDPKRLGAKPPLRRTRRRRPPPPTRRRREMSRLGTLGARLHRGEVGYDFVGKRKIWYGISILITITAIVGLAVRGLNMGIEFQGGAVFTTPRDQRLGRPGRGRTRRRPPATTRSSRSSATAACASRSAGIDTEQVRRRSRQTSPRTSRSTRTTINADLVGPSWGEQIANKAWQGLGDLHGPRGDLPGDRLRVADGHRRAGRPDPRHHHHRRRLRPRRLRGHAGHGDRSADHPRLLALRHGRRLRQPQGAARRTSPSRTAGPTARSPTARINGTLVRSINTTVVALLPVAGLLFIGGGVLGAGMLNDISLSLFVGLAAGAYSSIFIATPLVADLKEREPQMKALKKRVLAKRRRRPAAEGEMARRRAERADDDAGRGRRPGGRRPARPAARPAAGAAAVPRGSADDRADRASEELLLSRIRDVADYPKPGVMFKDITPLLADPAAFAALTDALAELCVRHGATKVVGLEARGFILAAPGRGPGGPRLHPRTQGGQAARSHPQPGVRPGVRLRRDRGARRGPGAPATASWSSTTSSPPAAPPRPRCELIRRAGAEVAGVAVLMELGFLGGRAAPGARAGRAPRWRP